MLIINDTNIWIDLKAINLIESVFHLPYDIGVPDILYDDELKDMDGELLQANGIKILEMTEDEIMNTVFRSRQTKKVSFNDLTTLVLAKSRGHILVTGDKNLRSIAQSENVALKGTIWLIDEMVRYSIITKKKAAFVCSELISLGRRLPREELINRINEWQSSEVAVD